MPNLFIGENPKLEAVYKEVPAAGMCAVITHPHSLMGGSMDNNVVMAAWNTVLGRGYSALRFNFRGVGRSGGAFDNGVGEVGDLATVVNYMDYPVIIVGYSFGSWVAANFLQEVDVPCIFISPPTSMFSFPSLKSLNIWAAVGSRDQFCDRSELDRILDKERIRVIGGADHFWFGSEDPLRLYLEKKLDLIRSISY
ncbi:MAG: alpha/beta fold hydrolase [Desulfomonilia bacterium]|jgi:alpha/beta superfamily hydrolase|nr:alpha/beta fold hydrolase [Deltaproteobacteria bacterium]MDX9761229.1 alpha/beta fold hydrolase [Desulfomonilia bacterium]